MSQFKIMRMHIIYNFSYKCLTIISLVIELQLLNLNKIILKSYKQNIP